MVTPPPSPIDIPNFYYIIFAVVGAFACLSAKTYVGEWASAIPVLFGSFIFLFRNQFVKPEVTDFNYTINNQKNAVNKLRSSVKDTLKLKHLGSVNKQDELSSSSAYSRVRTALFDQKIDDTMVELKNGRFVNPNKSQFSSAMDWHENEIIPPRRRTHKMKLYEGRS